MSVNEYEYQKRLNETRHHQVREQKHALKFLASMIKDGDFMNMIRSTTNLITKKERTTPTDEWFLYKLQEILELSLEKKGRTEFYASDFKLDNPEDTVLFVKLFVEYGVEVGFIMDIKDSIN